MKKKYTRFISFLIALVMICLCFPSGIIALELGDAELPAENIEEIPEEKIVELEALRESNVKHFRLPDGNYEAVSYGQAVHRKDADGVWQDINNDLSLTTVGAKQLYTTADSRVSYAKDFTANGELLTLRENGYTVSMAMLVQNSGNLSADATAVRVTTVNNASIQRKAQYDTLEEAAEINNRSSIVYSNVINNTDIEYIMVGNDIKENIIVKSRADSYEYAFRLSLVGLNATLMEGGYISLTDKESGEQKYVIPAPYMYDANHEYSNEVEYALIHAGGDKYLLTVTADENWINDEERAFPVKIDPTISWDSIVYDTYVRADTPNENHGNKPYMYICSPSSVEINALVRITIPSLPEGATFGGATLKLKYYYEITTGSMVTSAYKITEYWSENTVTYNSQPHYSTTYLASATLSASSSVTASTPGTATYTISDAVRAWLATPSSNYGVLIKYISGSNLSVILHSYESGSNYGYISITYAYTIPDGVYALGSRFSGNRWMTVENGSTTAGAHIQQTYSSTSPITNFDTSRLFKITRDSGTRYIIRSMLDNELTLYLSGTEVLTQTIPIVDDDVPNSKTFHLEWNGYGFIIRPYGTSTVVYLSSLSTANLTTGTVSSVGYSTKAAWTLQECELPEITLDVRYDNGFTLRYSDWEDRIYEGTAILQEKYLTCFGLWINILPPEQFTSLADFCGVGIDALCNHVSNAGCYDSIFCPDGNISVNPLHHTNKYNYLADLSNKRESADFIMVFTGHMLCKQGDHSENIVNSLGFCISDRALIIGSIASMPFERQAMTIVHEFGHFLNAPDHYDNGCSSTEELNDLNGTNTFDENCIYGENKEYLDELVICDGCQNIIRQTILSYQ